VMSPTFRNLVALGSTSASAVRTWSMRASEFGMPSVWLPDIEPDASNTIIASSVQGVGFLSSAGTGIEPNERTRNEASPAKATCRNAADDLPDDCKDIAQAPEVSCQI